MTLNKFPPDQYIPTFEYAVSWFGVGFPLQQNWRSRSRIVQERKREMGSGRLFVTNRENRSVKQSRPPQSVARGQSLIASPTLRQTAEVIYVFSYELSSSIPLWPTWRVADINRAALSLG